MLFKTNSNPFQLICLRQLSSIGVQSDALPVIKVPKYLEANLNKIRFIEKKKVDTFRQKQQQENQRQQKLDPIDRQPIDRNICIISSNDRKFNHYLGKTYRQTVDQIPLISKQWINGNKTNGQRMCFHVYGSNPSKVVRDVAEEPALTFESLGLTSNVCEAIHAMSISEPTTIQKAAIPSILDNNNVIFSAETGSGKTIAYLAPIIQMIREFKELKAEQTSKIFPKCLVVVPSRELAEQVGSVAQHFGAFCGIGVATMIGGAPKHITHTGRDLIVSTIGLIQPLVSKRVYSLKRLNHLVIDESDTLFDSSFNSEVLDLLSNVLVKDNDGNDMDESDGRPEESVKAGIQLVCVSATMPKNLDKTLGNVVDIESNFERISSNRLHHILPHIRQDFYRIDRYQRQIKLLELVLKDKQKGRPVMIFSNRSETSNWIYHYLNDNGIQCLRLNKDITDEERHNQLESFQSGECNVISCTDLGSRGLDTVRVRHVINYDCPHFVTDYIHRSGRTGRMGVKGHNCKVSTFVSYKPDVFMVQHLELALRLNRPIETIDDNMSSHLDRNREKIALRKQKTRNRPTNN